jgi:cation diffusion facilitator CzcD-associated flavoprotein CzcO
MTDGLTQDQRATRADCEVVVIGAGFGGLYAMQKLTQLGFSVVGFERGDDVGGVWHWNRYPGARCDCESYFYSYSFSDELQKDWSWSLRYSEQPEIERYLQHVADRFDLRRHYRFSTTVESAVFDDATSLWTVRSDKGDVVTARFVVAASGCLSTLQKPDIPGFDRFEGDVFYTADWPAEGVDFTGKRVGVIGTGASGIQVITRVARQAKHLTVFQRTANWVLPVWNGPMDPEFDAWSKSHHHEFRERCLTSHGALPYDPPRLKAAEVTEAERQAIFEDYWRRGGIQFLSAFSDLFNNIKSNEAAADFVRGKIREIVKDPALAERLTPNDHPIGTKRPPMEDGYYETFNRDNVELVDIRSAPITGFDGKTLLTKDGAYALDVLVMATGFDAITGALLAIDIKGKGGLSLRDEWAKGARSFLGIGVAGFPNLFTVTGPLSPSVLANMPTAVEQHVDWIADCLVHMREHGLTRIEPSHEAQDEWVAHVADVASGTFYERANSWYLGANIPGKPRQFGIYLGGFANYKRRCDAVAGQAYDGFELSVA